MKIEDFDDAIRGKLGSINSTGNRQEVNAVYDYVQSRKETTSKKRVAFLIITTSLIFTIGLLFIWNINQAKEINALKQHIVKLTEKGKNTAEKSVSPKTISELSNKTLNT